MIEHETKAILDQAGDEMPADSRSAIRSALLTALQNTPTSTAEHGARVDGPGPVVSHTVEVRPISIDDARSVRAQRRWVALIGAGAIAAAAIVVFAVRRDPEPATITDSVPAPVTSELASTPTVGSDPTQTTAPLATDSSAPNTAETTTDTVATPTTTAVTAPPPPAPLADGAVLPAGVDATSVSFPSALNGWLVGTLGDGSITLRHTLDGGVTWSEVTPPAPLLASASASIGETFRVVFADDDNGWLTGSDSEVSNVVVSTHDGGITWSPVTLSSTPGVSPMTVAVGAGMVHVIAFDPNASPAAFRIFVAPAGSDTFTASAVSIPSGAGPLFDAQFAFGGDAGWMVYNDRVLSGSARFVDGAWIDWTAPCDSSAAEVASVAAAPDGSSVVVACSPSGFGGSPTPIGIHRSADGGATFADTTTIPDGTPLDGGALPTVVFIAQPAPDVIVVGYYGSSSRGAIARSADGGATWTSVYDLGQEGYSSEFYAFPVTTASHAPLVVATGAGVGIVSSDDGVTWTPLALDAAAASGLAEIDLTSGRLFGFDAGGLHGTNTATPEQFLATATPVLGAPDLDTGWYTVPAHPDEGGADCWGGATVRVLIWGDLSLMFNRDGARDILTNWQLGGTDFPARGVDLVVPAPTPHPSGVTTVATAGDPAVFGLGDSVTALARLFPQYAPRGAGGQVSGFGGLNNSMYVSTAADGDTITRIAVENGC